MRTMIAIAALAAMAVSANNAFAHSDVLVRSNGTQVVTGAAEDIDGEEGGPFFDLETGVFEAVFLNPAAPTPGFGFNFERDEPGFASDDDSTQTLLAGLGQNLPAGADVSLNLLTFSLPSGTDDTFFWDGSGAVDFQPLSSAQAGVEFTFAPSTFATTGAGGAFDDHPLFGLTGPAADGVYLTSVSVGVDGLAPSEPLFMVWLANAALTTELLGEEVEEALEVFEGGGPAPIVAGVDFSFYEEAVEFAEGIPEPTSALLAAMAFVGLASRRR